MMPIMMVKVVMMMMEAMFQGRLYETPGGPPTLLHWASVSSEMTQLEQELGLDSQAVCRWRSYMKLQRRS